ncbi:MAG: YceI family protein, partial [Ginsengibacter sp.]
FNADQHPQILFSGKKYDVNNGKGTLLGNVTIAGITLPITLNVEFGGIVVDPYGQTKAGFTVTGKISRKEFGITYGSTLETGSVLLGDEINISAEIQLVKQAVEELVEELGEVA